MSNLVPVVAVGAVIARPGPRVLLIKRAQAPLAGQWTLPGGKVRGGESIAAAVEREALEETGLRVLAGDLVQVVELIREGFHYVIHDHLCTQVDVTQSPVAGDDAADVRWVLASELASLGVTDATARVILRALAMRQSCGEDE